jgi:hypothetical protein
LKAADRNFIAGKTRPAAAGFGTTIHLAKHHNSQHHTK